MKLEEIISEPGKKNQTEVETALYYEILGLNPQEDYKFSDIKKAYDAMKKQLNAEYRLAEELTTDERSAKKSAVVEKVRKVQEAYSNLYVAVPARLVNSVKGFVKGKVETIKFKGILLEDKINEIRTSKKIENEIKLDKKKEEAAEKTQKEDEERTKSEVAEEVKKIQEQKKLEEELKQQKVQEGSEKQAKVEQKTKKVQELAATYAVFGLKPNASMKDVKDAYAKLYINLDTIEDKTAKEEQAKLNNEMYKAYEIIKRKKRNKTILYGSIGTAILAVGIVIGTITYNKTAKFNDSKDNSTSDFANNDDYKTIPAGLNFNPNNIETMTNKASRLMEAAGAAGIKLDAKQAFDILIALNIKYINETALAKTGYTFDKDRIVDTFQNFGMSIANDIATATEDTKFDLSSFIADGDSSKFVKDSTDKLTSIKKEDVLNVRKYLEDTFVKDYNRGIESPANLIALYMTLGQGIYTNASESPLLNQDLFNKLLGVVGTCGDIKNVKGETETAFNFHATNLKEALGSFQNRYVAYVAVNKEYSNADMNKIIDAINKDANVIPVANPTNEQQQKELNAAAGVTKDNTKPNSTSDGQFVTDDKTLTQEQKDAAKAAEQQKNATDNAAKEADAKALVEKKQAAYNKGIVDKEKNLTSNPSQFSSSEEQAEYNKGYADGVVKQEDIKIVIVGQTDPIPTPEPSNSSNTTTETNTVPGLDSDLILKDGYTVDENGNIVPIQSKTK